MVQEPVNECGAQIIISNLCLTAKRYKQFHLQESTITATSMHEFYEGTCHYAPSGLPVRGSSIGTVYAMYMYTGTAETGVIDREAAGCRT